jgi:S1-C subfamily serine protease
MYESPSSPPPPWPGPSVPPPPAPPRGAGIFAVLLAVFTAIAVVGAGYFGYQLAHDPDPGSPSFTSTNQVTRSVDVDAQGIARRLDDSIVNITTRLSTGERAAGTGIIISSNGLVLTNNHVIAQSTQISTENEATGRTASARVLGYDVANDVAVLQLEGVSHLTAAPLGDASSVRVGDAVVGLGNAGGQGGAPSVAPGTVTALNRRITATDASGEDAETLTGMIQVDAAIQPGDSGGPLVNARGQVIGIDAAASDPRIHFGFQGGGSGTGEGFAIPIEHAVTIARAITGGRAGGTIHVGAHRGLLGVQVRDDRTVDGALVVGVQSGSGADDAGMTSGAVIVGVDGTPIGSATDLTHALAASSPGDRVRITWTGDSGDQHRATIRLGSGPPA